MKTNDVAATVTLKELAARAAQVLDAADARDLSIVTAESCTGGLLAALLTDIEGRSHVFERGFVVYSKEAKCELLSLERDRIERCGVVSRETAEDMARGALDASRGHVSLAITGFAGPGASEDEPGLVHIAAACREGSVHHREEHFGDIGRDNIRLRCLDTALTLLAAAIGGSEKRE